VGPERVPHPAVGEERLLLGTDDAGDHRQRRWLRLLPTDVTEHHEPDHAQQSEREQPTEDPCRNAGPPERSCRDHHSPE
jgi:hypothetical protein